MKALWHWFLWRCMPRDMRERLLYTEELGNNLFVSLPNATKRSFIRQAQEVLRYSTFIETGTYLGDMALHASHLFHRVHTIELSPKLAEVAARRLAPYPHVTIHRGDSASVLRQLLPTIDSSCAFWLDAHYSGGMTARSASDTPILAELEAIAEHPVRPHAIFIDDARIFGTDRAYPTLEAVFARLREIDPDFQIGISSDIVWASASRILRFEWCVDRSGSVVGPTTAPSTLKGGIPRWRTADER